MRGRGLRIPLTLLVLAGLLVAGCSSTGASTDETTNTETLSKADYADRAEDVMVDFGNSFEELGKQIAAAQSPAEFTGAVDQVETAIRTAIDDFGALRPPEDAQKGHDQLLSALENLSSKLSDVGKEAQSDRKSAVRDAATALRTATFEFNDQYLQAQQSLQDVGIEFGVEPDVGSGS